LQAEAELDQFYAELISILNKESHGNKKIHSNEYQTPPEPLNHVLAQVFEARAHALLAHPSLFNTACQLWTSATGIGMPNIQSISKFNVSSVHFIASRLCMSSQHVSASTSPAALKETITSAKIATKFFSALLSKLFDNGMLSISHLLIFTGPDDMMWSREPPPLPRFDESLIMTLIDAGRVIRKAVENGMQLTRSISTHHGSVGVDKLHADVAVCLAEVLVWQVRLIEVICAIGAKENRPLMRKVQVCTRREEGE
jgi:hypothetical protein